MLILHKCCRAKTKFSVFNYDLTSLKFCESFPCSIQDEILKNPLSELCEKESGHFIFKRVILTYNNFECGENKIYTIIMYER